MPIVNILTFAGRSTLYSTSAASAAREVGLAAAIALHNRGSVKYELRMRRVYLPVNYSNSDEPTNTRIVDSLRNESFAAVFAANPDARHLASRVAQSRGSLPLDTTSAQSADDAHAVLLLDSVAAVAPLVAQRVLERNFRRVAIVTPKGCAVAAAVREQLCRVAVNVTRFVEFERSTSLENNCDGECLLEVSRDSVDVVIVSGRAEEVISLSIRIRANTATARTPIFITFAGVADSLGLRTYIGAFGVTSEDITYWRPLPSVSFFFLVVFFFRFVLLLIIFFYFVLYIYKNYFSLNFNRIQQLYVRLSHFVHKSPNF